MAETCFEVTVGDGTSVSAVEGACVFGCQVGTAVQWSRYGLCAGN